MEDWVFIFKKFLIPLLFFTQTVWSVENLESWLSSFCNQRLQVIQSAISECIDELSEQYQISEKDFCLYSLGSFSSDILLPQSDFEFGMLISTDVDSHFVDSLLPLLRGKLNALSIHFDNHQMVPLYYENGKGFGTACLRSSPENVIEILRSHSLSLCYLLYFTKYIYGNSALYQAFCDARSSLHKSMRATFIKEIRATMQKNYNVHSLCKIIDNEQECSEKAHINFKKHLFRPLVDFINYLSFLHNVSFASPFIELKELTEIGVFESHEEDEIRNALLFAFEHRLLYGDDIYPLKNLSSQELQALRRHFDTISFLTQKTSEAASATHYTQ